MSAKSQVIELRNLDAGDKFRFANCSNYKDLVVKRYNECGIIIAGLVKYGEDNDWKHLSLGYSVSAKSEVIYIE